jgi:hypothetical protein
VAKTVDGVATDYVLDPAAGLTQVLVESTGGESLLYLRVLGLNRYELKRWQRQGIQDSSAHRSTERELVCTTPFAGLWLLVPPIIDSGLVQAAHALEIVGRTRVQAIQIVLTLVAWSALGFRRLFHLDDFRDWADMGLALFTGVLRLWSDTTLWCWVHGVTAGSAATFYQTTASQVAGRPSGRGRFSLDEHVVPSFTKRKPRPLGKTRVPFRLYAPFDLDLGRFVGLLVRKARQTLSQVLPDLLTEIRRLRCQVKVQDPERVRLIFDRGGYKGSLFETLMEDPQVSFIAMARRAACSPTSRRVTTIRISRSPALPLASPVAGTPCLRLSSGMTPQTSSNGGVCSSSKTNLVTDRGRRPLTPNIANSNTTRWALPNTCTPWSGIACPRPIRCSACPTNRGRSARR